MRKMILLSLLLYLLMGCEKSNDMSEVRIDDELQRYFDSFASAGAERGVSVDYESAQVEGLISELDDQVSGQCQHDADAPDRVVIDPDYWGRISHMQREFIIFHELGHCLLNRSHMDDSNEDGSCASIMHSSSSGCRNLYSSATREIYLDELFGE